MLSKRLHTSAIALLLCLLMAAGVLAGCQDSGGEDDSSQSKNDSSQTPSASTSGGLDSLDMDVEPTRSNYTKLSEELKSLYKQSPDDADVAVAYAEKLLQLGDIDEAKKVLAPFITGENPAPQAINLAAHIAYLTGKYDESEKLYNQLKDLNPEYTELVEQMLTYIYYQTNQYTKANDLKFGEDGDPAWVVRDMLREVGENPYSVDWNGKEEAVIPMTRVEPLPIVPVVINGVKINCMLDTGCGDTAIDQTAVDKLGIKPFSHVEDGGTGAAGDTADIGFGRADTLEIGGVTITNVPVVVTDLGQFNDFWDNEVPVDAVLGTGVLKEFIPTIDFLEGNLVLRPKNEIGQQAYKEQQKQYDSVEEMPFVMALDHFLVGMGQGSINGVDSLNFFMDSGLPLDDSVILPTETMKDVGIPFPELDKTSLGLAGEYSYGSCDISKLGLGQALQENATGSYGSFPEDLYYDPGFGFFIDTLISHSFFRDYAWTIDFTSMNMTFSK